MQAGCCGGLLWLFSVHFPIHEYATRPEVSVVIIATDTEQNGGEIVAVGATSPFRNLLLVGALDH